MMIPIEEDEVLKKSKVKNNDGSFDFSIDSD